MKQGLGKDHDDPQINRAGGDGFRFFCFYSRQRKMGIIRMKVIASDSGKYHRQHRS